MDSYTLLLEFVKGKDAGAIMRRLDDGRTREIRNLGICTFTLERMMKKDRKIKDL